MTKTSAVLLSHDEARQACGQRLRQLLQECHLSPSDFAFHCNVTPQHVNNWFGRGVPYVRVDAIAKTLGVNREWLLSGLGVKYPGASPHAVTDDVAGPIMPARVVHLMYEAPLPRQLLQAMNVAADSVVFTSMLDDRMAQVIQEGALVAFDRSITSIKNGDLYVIEHQGAQRIGYVHQRADNGWRVCSHNRLRYPDEHYTAQQVESQGLRLLGRVFWWGTLNPGR